MSNDDPIPVTSLRLPVDLKAELQRLADDDRRSLSNLIVKVLRDHVESRGKAKWSR